MTWSPPEPNATYALLALAYLACAYGWYRWTGSLAHPAVVHSVSWLVPVVWLWLFSHDLSPISWRLAGLLLMASGAFFLPFAWLPRVKAELPPLRSRLGWSRGLVAALVAVFLLPLASAFLAYQVLGAPPEFSLGGLRESLAGDARRPSIGIGYIFPIVVGAMFLVWQTCPYRWLRFLSVMSAGLLAVLSTSKIYFLITLFVLAAPTRKLSTSAVLQRLAAGGVIGLSVFAAIHLATERVIGGEGALTVGDTARAVLLTVAVYSGGPVAALDQELARRNHIPDGYLLIDHPLLARVLDMGSPPGGPGFTFIPEIGMNVFTGYAPVLHEFGWAGLALFMVGLGLAYYVLYGYRARPSGRFLYAFSLFPLAFLFFADFFVMASFIWIGFLFSSALLSRVLEVDVHV